MDTARTYQNRAGEAPEDDAEFVGEKLTTKQEAFALKLADCGNQSAAYRHAYNVRPTTPSNVVWANASRLANHPGVKARVAQLREQAALETIVSIQQMLQHELDIATADPNEISYVAKRSCRHCYGHDFRYQWIDTDEYVTACIEAMDAKKNPPTDEGGYGYTRDLPPMLTCPKCLGNGIEEIVVNDTRKLEGKARKLFKGLDYKNGQWVVLMHDQAKARENILRMLGAYNDKLDLTAGKNKPTKLPDGLDEQGAARAYLTMIG